MRQELQRYRQRLQHSLIRHGYVYRGGRNWAQSYRHWLGELNFAEAVLAETVQIYFRRIQELEEKLGLMDLRIREFASSATVRTAGGAAALLSRDRLSDGAGDRGGGGRLSALRECAGVYGFPGPGAERTLQWFASLARSDHEDRQWAPAPAVGGGGLALSPQLRAQQGADRAARGHVGGTDRTHGACRAATGAQVRMQHRVLHRKRSQVAVTSVARELAGFIWAMMVEVGWSRKARSDRHQG